jgi:hypothetical protein
MVLKRGDTGDAVKVFQRGLNKLGAMLIVDGQFGAGTRDAVEQARTELRQPGPPDEADDGLQKAVADAPDPFPPTTAAGVTFIARAEVSDAVTYRKRFQVPCCPPSPSGITIGIGYDCRFATPDELRADWKGLLSDADIGRLIGVSGKEGTDALRQTVGDVVVPLHAAMSVFVKRTLPLFLSRVRSIYPEVDRLSPARRAALLSLVYNRGNRLSDSSAERQDRREMRTIRDLLAAGRDDEVGAQFESMTRLWDPAKAPGLITRRREEAKLWNEGFAAVRLE